MLFWLIYRREDAEKNSAYIECYKRLAPQFGMVCELKLVETLVFGVRESKPFLYCEGAPCRLPDFAVVRTIYPELNLQLELLGVRCFNSYRVSELCNNKAYTYRHLSGKGIPMPDTVFVANRDIAAFLKNCKPGTVLKSVDGHGGQQVMLYQGNDEEVQRVIGRSDMVAQQRIGTKNSDLRVYIVGKRILAAVLRTSNEGFRANFSLGGEVRLYTLNESETALVNRILQEFEFDLVGIDFLIAEDGSLCFNEIEDVVGARMLYRCSDIDIVAEYLSYISECIKSDTVLQA